MKRTPTMLARLVLFISLLLSGPTAAVSSTASDELHLDEVATPVTPFVGAVRSGSDETSAGLIGQQRPAQTFLKQPPQKAKNVLEAIQKRHGEPLPGHVGGRGFQNRERRLPQGRYREYDVNPRIPGRDRGAERLVIDQTTGKAYYTDDHYRTFTPMN